MRTGWLARTLATIAVLVLVTFGCRDAGPGVQAVESLPRSVAAEEPRDDPGPSDTVLRGGAGGGGDPEPIFEFGLFGPVEPALGADIYESDCNFEDDPYETCL